MLLEAKEITVSREGVLVPLPNLSRIIRAAAEGTTLET
jgi:hypothetical protein